MAENRCEEALWYSCVCWHIPMTKGRFLSGRKVDNSKIGKIVTEYDSFQREHKSKDTVFCSLPPTNEIWSVWEEQQVKERKYLTWVQINESVKKQKEEVNRTLYSSNGSKSSKNLPALILLCIVVSWQLVNCRRNLSQCKNATINWNESDFCKQPRNLSFFQHYEMHWE